MGYKNREVEIKLLVASRFNVNTVNAAVAKALENYPRCRENIVGFAADTYWKAPEDSNADFVRLRILDEPDSKGNTSQITLKSSDRGNNVNRVEVDLGISDTAQGNTLLTMMLGDPQGQVTKRYTVYFLEDEHTTVSVYKVVRDKRIFVEVEGKSMKSVKQITRDLLEVGLEFDGRCKGSLYNMFVEKKPTDLTADLFT